MNAVAVAVIVIVLKFSPSAWFKQAAAAGDPAEIASHGDFSLVFRDYPQARHWYEKAAALRNPHAMYMLGIVYECGLGVPKDYQQARQWYNKAADSQDPNAKEQLQNISSDVCREIGR